MRAAARSEGCRAGLGAPPYPAVHLLPLLALAHASDVAGEDGEQRGQHGGGLGAAGALGEEVRHDGGALHDEPGHVLEVSRAVRAGQGPAGRHTRGSPSTPPAGLDNHTSNQDAAPTARGQRRGRDGLLGAGPSDAQAESRQGPGSQPTWPPAAAQHRSHRHHPASTRVRSPSPQEGHQQTDGVPP